MCDIVALNDSENAISIYRMHKEIYRVVTLVLKVLVFLRLCIPFQFSPIRFFTRLVYRCPSVYSCCSLCLPPSVTFVDSLVDCSVCNMPIRGIPILLVILLSSISKYFRLLFFVFISEGNHFFSFNFLFLLRVRERLSKANASLYFVRVYMDCIIIFHMKQNRAS